MNRKQRKALERHKAIVKARNVRNNNLRYGALTSTRWLNRVFRRWAF